MSRRSPPRSVRRRINRHCWRLRDLAPAVFRLQLARDLEAGKLTPFEIRKWLPPSFDAILDGESKD